MTAGASLPPLWTCPKCGAKFVSANMSHLRVGLILERRLPADPRLVETMSFGPRSHAHYFRIDRASQLDASMAALLREAYDSGTQKNFQRVGNSARRKPQGV